MDVFVSWSGGKDCCLALYRAQKMGLKVSCLVSMISDNTGRLWPHYLSPAVLDMQARAMGINIIQRWAKISAEDYKAEYIKLLKELKQQGITGGVFGDVSIGNGLAKEHWQWADGVCQPVGITAYRPLWNQGREGLIREFIESGFVAVIIAAEMGLKNWLGRKLDGEMLAEMKSRYEASPSGEVGFYHTLVVDGPLFKKRLEILDRGLVYASPFWYLDINKIDLKQKGFD